MASSLLHSTLTPPNLLSSPKLCPKTLAKAPSIPTIRCGASPRSDRRAPSRGRILSTEAILAIQSLKRAYNKSSSSTSEETNFPNLSRLIKSDLFSILRELLRQDLCPLALHVLSTLRSEFPDSSIDLNPYADVINGLSRNRMFEYIDGVVAGLEEDEGRVRWGSDKGLVRVVKGVVEAGRRESAVRICRMMKRSGCGDTWTADEYVVKCLSRGLRRMGEEELAIEVEREFQVAHKGNFQDIQSVKF